MSPVQRFTSPEIAKEMAKLFGEKAKKFPVELKYMEQASNFVRKIEEAHKQAAKSKLVFKCL